MGQTGSKQLNPPIKPGDVKWDDQLQAEIFKLKMDQFEDIFDWLSLGDMVALGQTCKRLQHIVGYYISTTYTAIQFESTFDGIKTPGQQKHLNGLSSYVKKLAFRYLEIVPDDPERPRKWWQKWRGETPPQIIPYMRADQFKSLTEIELITVELADAGIERIKGILGQLETVKLKYPHLYSSGACNDFLQFCTNVKHLCVKGPFRSTNRPFGGVFSRSWLRQKYPKLEHFELSMSGNKPIVELPTFFALNTSVKTFTAVDRELLRNSDTFKTTKAKLDVLGVEFYLESLSADAFNSLRNLLNELYDNGFFKELHFCFFSLFVPAAIDQKAVDALIPFKCLTKLYVEKMKDGTDISSLINLKQLHVRSASSISNMTTLATKLVNLEFIEFTFANFDNILPFVRHSAKLPRIAVHRLVEEEEEVIPKVGQLNRERSKLPNARKVIIYVNEPVYLAVKWAKNQTDWSLVEIKRGASYDGLNYYFDIVNKLP